MLPPSTGLPVQSAALRVTQQRCLRDWMGAQVELQSAAASREGSALV